MKHAEHIQAQDARRGDILRRGTGELVTVLDVSKHSPWTELRIQTGRGHIYTLTFPDTAPVLVVAR